jgi:hypothetical protein
MTGKTVLDHKMSKSQHAILHIDSDLAKTLKANGFLLFLLVHHFDQPRYQVLGTPALSITTILSSVN